MPGGRPGPGDAAALRAAESLRAIEAGGIPPVASERLRAFRAEGGRFFTSDLTAAEFLVAREAGFRPLTQVMGSCFYAVGWQGTPFAASQQWAYSASRTYELSVQTDAWNEARTLALSRLRQEAELAGADAVLGVEVSRGAYDWAQGLIEFVAVGTAVRSERYDFEGDVFLSTLSGQEFASLVRNGYMPLGISAGSTVAYVVGGVQTLGMRWQNRELTELTNGLYDARTLAMRRVAREAHELGAAGIVATRLGQHQEAHEVDQQGAKRLDLVVTMHVIGTAIAVIEEPDDPPPTYIALSLTEENR